MKIQLPFLGRLYFCCAGILLLALSGAKLLSCLQDTPVLDVGDPVFGCSLRSVLLIVGTCELLAAILLLSSSNAQLLSWVLLLISALAIGYRLTKWGMGVAPPCPCLGLASDWMGWHPVMVDRVLRGTLVYFIIGSSLILLTGRDMQVRGEHDVSA